MRMGTVCAVQSMTETDVRSVTVNMASVRENNVTVIRDLLVSVPLHAMSFHETYLNSGQESYKVSLKEI